MLGIDVGDKRIGLAVSDELGTVASPLVTIHRERDADAVDRIARTVNELRVGVVVVGIPYSMDGSTGPQALKTLRFVEKLRPAVGMPVRLWDESLSTRRAEEGRRRLGRRDRKKGEKDRIAAAYILQDYLDAVRKSGGGL
ncbi:MAG: Holliday junction resolvase RuvX [Nitrospirae bacterium]|nr:Holliday junction resolvase RuvX [Nitrospirota bacterium]